MKTLLHAIQLAFISVFLFGCSRSPVSSGPAVSTYMPLNVGDIRQFVSNDDSSTILWKIVGEAKRKDGYNVFINERTAGTQKPDTAYFCLRDGYFMSTQLDTTDEGQILATNPFNEQRLAKLTPTDGEQWNNIVGRSDSSFFIARHFDQKTARCGDFQDVFGFTFSYYSNGALDTLLTPFYAPNIGFIGTDMDKDLQPDVSASYLKVGNIELGRLWPAKNPLPTAMIGERNRRERILRSIFGIL